VPNDNQRFTPYGLKYLLNKAGFQKNEIVGAGGWRIATAQFISAYISFGIKNNVAKKLLKAILYYPILIMAKDKEVTEFNHTSMINLLTFKAIKE
jgi:hypothetical protein